MRLGQGDGRWTGAAITLEASPYGGELVLVRLVPSDSSAILSPAESRVAQAVIAGQTLPPAPPGVYPAR